jgi:hypothetical protein
MIIGVGIIIWISQQSKDLEQYQANRKRAKRHSLPTLVAISVLFITLAYIPVHLATISDDLPQTIYPQSPITRPFDILPLALFIFGGTLIWVWLKQEQSGIKSRQSQSSFGYCLASDHFFIVGDGGEPSQLQFLF